MLPPRRFDREKHHCMVNKRAILTAQEETLYYVFGGRAQEGQNMIPRWLTRSAVSVLAILLFAFTAWEFPVLAILVAVLGGLAGLLFLVTRARRMPPLLAEEERGKHERFLRDVPPPGG